ncbi:hypothetical protein ACFX16_004384 [Malus domestica]
MLKMAVACLSTTMLTLIPCPTSSCPTRLARQSLTGKQKPDSNPQQAPNLQGSCVLVGQETSPTEIPTPNIVLARPVGSTKSEDRKTDMPEDLQTTLFQMLQRLEKASTGSRSDIDVVHPKGERRRNS